MALKKLYFTPPGGRVNSLTGPGKLEETLDELSAAGFNPEVVGHGYPPAYVLTEEKKHPEVKAICLRVCPETTFSTFRTDLDGKEAA